MKVCGSTLHTAEYFDSLELRMGISTPAAIRHSPRPPAVIEWFDCVRDRWLPLCADCLLICKEVGEQADREFAVNPALQKRRRELANRFREVQ